MGKGRALDPSSLALAALGMWGSVLLTGCDLAEGLAIAGSSLGNPDAALLDSPGRKLASGQYHGLLVDGSLSDGGHVIAIRTDRGEQEVAILPYLDGDGCFISPGVAVERISSRIDVELSGLLAVQRSSDEAGLGEVGFVNFSCKDVYDPLELARMPQIIFPAGAPRGILTLAADGSLYLVSADGSGLDLIAKNVALARTAGDTLWTIESGELVGRDSNLNEFARTGTGVSEFVIPGGTRILAAYRDESGLNTYSAADGAQTISTGGCAVLAWGPEAIAFTDPCGDGALNVYTLGSQIGVDEEFVRIIGPSAALFPERALSYWGKGNRATEIVMLLNTGAGQGGRLIVARLPSTPKKTDDAFTLSMEVLTENDAFIRGGQIYTGWDGQMGTLVEQERNDNNRTIGLKEIARGVAQLPGASPFSGAGILTDFDGKVGTLRSLSRNGDMIDSRVLARDVPIQTHTVEAETGRRAFIADSDDGAIGTLYLMDLPPEGGKATPVEIADNVYADTARFLEQPHGVAYLTKLEGYDFGQLRVWLLDAGFEFTVHEHVSEYRTVPWPAAGILYAVPSGDDQGLWFSKAR